MLTCSVNTVQMISLVLYEHAEVPLGCTAINNEMEYMRCVVSGRPRTTGLVSGKSLIFCMKNMHLKVAKWVHLNIY